METLLDETQSSNEVRILTIPHKFILSSNSTFDKVKKLLSGKRLVYNFDPSKCLQMDRKMYHLEQIADLRRQGNEVHNQTFTEELRNITSTEFDQGFYKNIFRLNFSDECEFSLDLMKSVVYKGINSIKGPDSSSEIEENQFFLRKAQEFIWKSFVQEKDYYFLNENIKLMFEFNLLQGFDQGN
jgi:hypothetical protein